MDYTPIPETPWHFRITALGLSRSSRLSVLLVQRLPPAGRQCLLLVISSQIWVITVGTRLLLTAHEPPSGTLCTGLGLQRLSLLCVIDAGTSYRNIALQDPVSKEPYIISRTPFSNGLRPSAIYNMQTKMLSNPTIACNKTSEALQRSGLRAEVGCHRSLQDVAWPMKLFC